jgi:predicted nucleotidyltransferase
MKRPVNIRTPPRSWLKVLAEAYPFLRDHGLGDLTIFGSQAMSIYLKNPLRSKDLDLVSSQIGPAQHDLLRDHLSHIPWLELRSTSVQSRPLARGDLKTYTIELRIDKRPFFLEIFDKILDGRSPRVLADYLEERRRWGLRLWVPNPNALVALRLCFRQPEGISRLNAIRLNRFITEGRKRISMREVQAIITRWELWPLVGANVEALYKRNRIRIASIEKILTAKNE